MKNISINKKVKNMLLELYDEAFAHNGYGEMNVEIGILHRGQKEIIIHCGRQYRFVVDYQNRDGRKQITGNRGREKSYE